MIKIAFAYPDLLNLYGDYANVKLLEKRLEGCGQEVRLTSFSVGEEADIASARLLYFGAGTEYKMLDALQDLRRLADGEEAPLNRMLKNGGRILATGNSMALLCEKITDLRDGKEYRGLGLIPGEADIVGGLRRYGEVLCDCSLCKRKVVGTVNSSVDFRIGTSPLFQVTFDSSRRLSGGEGYVKEGSIYATELTGPLLYRNPELLDAFARMMTVTVRPCEDRWYREMELGYAHALNALESAKK